MSDSRPALALSESERAKVASVEARVASGGPEDANALLGMLAEPSWAVRRAVVAGLASLGDVAVPGLVSTLRAERGNEARIAAAVDAMSASVGSVDLAGAELANDADPAVAADGAHILGRRRAVSAVPVLERLVLGKDDNVAVAAIEALGRIGGRRAMESLVQAARGDGFFRVFPAIDVLGRTGDPRAVAPLADLLDNPLYAREAARALARTGDRAAVAPLAKLLGRPGEANVRVGAVALAELYEQADLRHGKATAIVEALRPLSTTPVMANRLAQSLRHADPTEQVAMCAVLGALANEEAIATLSRLVEEPPPIGQAASRALNRLGRDAQAELLSVIRRGGSSQRLAILPFLSSVDAKQIVLECLADEDPAVRALACATLARFGDPQLVEALFERLEDPEAEVVQAALAAIQALGGAETERRAILLARSPTMKLRRAALRILAYFGYESALDVFVAAMSDDDTRIRELALNGMALIEDERATTTLLGAAKDASERTRAAAAKAMGQKDGEPRVVAALMGALDDGDSWVRYYACQSLGKLKCAQAAPKIEALLTDEAGQVRVSAIEALSHMSGDSARRALLSATASADADVQRAALIGLGIGRHPDALPTLLAAAKAKDPTTRLMAISALEKFETEDIVPVLVAAVGDGERSVRTAAWAFLAARPGSAATVSLVALLETKGNADRAATALSSFVPGRVETISSMLPNADEHLAQVLVSALARMGTKESTAAILRGMRAPNPVVRGVVAPTLSALGTRDAMDALRRASTDDSDLEVRRICALLMPT